MNPTHPGHEPDETGLPFTVVGIGASAGGIEALGEFLKALEPQTGMAFVIVQHLDPNHASRLAEILSRFSSLPVREVAQNTPVQPDTVYVIPPGKDLVLSEGILQLSPRTEIRGQHRPVDRFFRSLAEEQGAHSIGIILSGTGNDGTLGLEELKAAGGISFAQDETAQQAGMPRNAVSVGSVDFVLPPAEIAHEIFRISRHAFVAPSVALAPETRDESRHFDRVLELLLSTTGVDFSRYKRNTLVRRLARRMVLLKIDDLEQYARFLETTPAEVEALHQDILINVTSFFRDPEAFETLKNDIFPRLIQDKSRHQGLRVWVLGCSTGEEAYSIAMSYLEFAETEGSRIPLQVFATDLNAAGIEKARAGLYSKGIVQEVSAERLHRFFLETDGSYRISKPVRDMCIFARQNVLADPPFSRMDLIACRNVLIYLEPPLQQRLLPVLHYSLRPGGILWLGHSETTGANRDLFETVDEKQKFFSRKETPSAQPVSLSLRASIGTLYRFPEPRIPGIAEALSAGPDAYREADQMLARFAPPSVLLSSDFEIVQFRGDTSPYLAPAPGRASLNLFKMLREGLLVPVSKAVKKAKQERVPVRENRLHVRFNDAWRPLNLLVLPLKGGTATSGCLLLLFEDPDDPRTAASGTLAPDAVLPEGPEPGAPDPGEPESRLRSLEQELFETRAYLQSVIEQQESTNEELQSANEEVQSANEELQSVNEELETSKEEIQSSNEELATVNEELQTRYKELAESANDLTNLISSVQMAIVMVDRELRIRRFTPSAEKLLELIPADVGRPIENIRMRFDLPPLGPLLAEVMESEATREMEIQDPDGHWYLFRLQPYRTSDKRTEGAILLLMDVDEVKRGQQRVHESEARFELLADSAPVLIWVKNFEGVQFVNKAFLDYLGMDQTRVQGFQWVDHIHPEERHDYVARYLDAYAERAPFEHQFRFRRADGVYRWMKAVGHPRTLPSGELLGYVGCTFDIDDLKKAVDNLADEDRHRNEFLAMLGHELRNPLAVLSNALNILDKQRFDPVVVEKTWPILQRQMKQMVRLVDDLLDASRIVQGSIPMRFEPVDLAEIAREALDATRENREKRGQSLTVSIPDEPLLLIGDAVRLTQVIGNLLGNASKFTPPGGRIGLSVAVEGGPGPGAAPAWTGSPGQQAVIRVEDDGMGIETGTLPRMFELFMQADRSMRRTQDGLGIGLALAKQLVELHSGTIEARSEGPGRGSVFVVRLPVTPVSDHPPATAGIPAQSVPKTRHRILVVDDNKDLCETVESILRTAGHEVKVARDGPSALREAAEFLPRIVLLDIGLPDTDGFEVARRIRRENGHAAPVLIAISGYGSGEDRRRGREAGFDEHLTKPVDPQALLELVARVPA